MTSASIFERLRSLGGPATTTEAEVLVRATLSALGSRLPAADRALLARTLPETFHDALDRPTSAEEASLGAFGAAVAGECKLDPSHGVEQLEIACRVVAERLDGASREAQCRHLPDALAPLLSLPGAEALPTRIGAPRSDGRATSERRGRG
ncbi:MAG: DUF2267 domain-containing protein [Polyangiales bacterium]